MAANAPLMIYNLLNGTVSAISATSDDNVTLSPLVSVPNTAYPDNNPSSSSLIYVKQHPYPQENDPSVNVPLVVVGPAVRSAAEATVGYGLLETHQWVEIRVVTRDWMGDDVPFKVSGDLIRRKLLDGIRATISANKSNPDGTGQFLYMVVADSGRDSDERQGVPLYRTAMQVEVAWFE